MDKRKRRAKVVGERARRKRLAERRRAKLDKEPPGITENGKRIRRFMIENKVKGNYKDYVIIAGANMIEHNGSYNVVYTRNGEPHPPVQNIALVHKKNLKNVINAEMAARFWHPRLGRLGTFIKPATKKDLH